LIFESSKLVFVSPAVYVSNIDLFKYA